MKVIYGIGNFNKCAGIKKVVAVGVFDGVHKGHQLILHKVAKEAKERGIKSAVVTFAFHPSRFFSPESGVSHLTSLEHKLLFIEKEGIDFCYVINFNKVFSRMPAEGFLKNILINKIEMNSLYVGEDFVFGRGAKEGRKLLVDLSRKFNFKLCVLKHLKINNRIVSSTLIRNLIGQGNLKLAEIFLGRKVSILGEVIKGEGRGKTLGYPTANIMPHHEAITPDGIYAAQAFCEGKIFKSVAYIGKKPTFRKSSRDRSIEVFLMNFKGNVYGKKMEIRFIKKIRADKKFPSKDALILQIKKDILVTEKILNKK